MRAGFYQACVDAGVEIDHHESDLYIPVNETTGNLLREYEQRATTFVSQIDNKLWYDVPFAYLPWWEAKAR